MKRRLFNLATALSLLLGVAWAALWARSYRGADEFAWRRHNGEIKFAAERGTALLVLDRGPRGAWPAEWYGFKHFHDPRSYPVAAAVARMNTLSIDLGDRYVMGSRAGFEWYYYQPSSQRYSRTVAIAPFWALTLVTAMLPIGWIGNRLRLRRNARRGFCACGYDLRESPERCPECGTARPSSSKSPNPDPLET